VTFGVLFVSSADEVWDYTNNDDTVLASSASDELSYVAGATTSPTFDVEVPVLAAHDPNNNILAVEGCEQHGTEHIHVHVTTVISYSDATMDSSTVTAGGTGTISLIDGTDDTLACDGAFTTGPYTMGMKVYSSFDAFDNSADPVVVIPEGWDNDGPGFGSFTKNELADGVDETFTVPESLAADFGQLDEVTRIHQRINVATRSVLATDYLRCEELHGDDVFLDLGKPRKWNRELRGCFPIEYWNRPLRSIKVSALQFLGSSVSTPAEGTHI
jgi:hypothetical protein